ncbi:MAG: endolytic transglycosylase MltG, partial [Arenimonas sp.]|nr:endolytic transglycosylase MltG [Arenimonas sp.]
AHPDGGGALYFVAKDNREHQFSTTYKEHQQAVKQYQLKK